MMKMLEVDNDFAKKVAVPAVSSLRELGTALEGSQSFSHNDITRICNIIQERMGSGEVGVGIKTIMSLVYEAKAGGQESDIPETLAELIIEKIQQMTI